MIVNYLWLQLVQIWFWDVAMPGVLKRGIFNVMGDVSKKGAEFFWDNIKTQSILPLPPFEERF